MKPTPPDLTEPPLPVTLEACHTVIRESWDLVQEMRQRLQVLEEQVKLNSRASSKPPSSDRPRRSSRLSKPKIGHKGSHRAMLHSDEVDQQVLCKPELQGPQRRGEVLIEADKLIRHQVFDLPPIKP